MVVGTCNFSIWKAEDLKFKSRLHRKTPSKNQSKDNKKTSLQGIKRLRQTQSKIYMKSQKTPKQPTQCGRETHSNDWHYLPSNFTTGTGEVAWWSRELAVLAEGLSLVLSTHIPTLGSSQPVTLGFRECDTIFLLLWALHMWHMYTETCTHINNNLFLRRLQIV